MGVEGNNDPSVGISYEIDQRAIKTFLAWLPDSWLPRPQTPDVFLDYVVETVENGEPTGLQFAAQIKGIRADKEKKSAFSFSFKTKHLRYYSKHCKHPVFLFRINTATGEGYWLFAQQYIREQLSAEILARQKTATIAFPSGNKLSEFENFKQALTDAEKYIRNLHPGSIQAALQKHKSELELKDPRISVAIAAQEGKQDIIVTAKEEFSFTTRFHNLKAEAWRDFIERGSELKVRSKEIEIIGLPLFEELSKSETGEFSFQYGTAVPAYVHIFLSDVEDSNVVHIEGNVRQGTKFGIFQGAISESPFKMSLEFALDAAHANETQKSHLFIDMNKWVGLPIPLLPHFDQFDLLIREINKPQSPKVNLYVQGHRVWSGDMGEINKRALSGISSILNWLRKCRLVSRHFGLIPLLPDKVFNKQWVEVEIVHDLLTKGETKIPCAGLSLSLTIPNPAPELPVMDKGTLLIPSPDQSFNIFGKQVHLGSIHHAFTQMQLVSRSRVEDSKTLFVFNGTKETEQILSRPKGPLNGDKISLQKVQK